MKTIIKRFIITAIFLIVAILIINHAPEYDLVYKYKDGDLRVIFNDKEITRDTTRLPQVAVLLNGEIMLSQDTIDYLFDKDLFYEKKYDTLITTYEEHRADITVGSHTIKVDGKEKAIKVPAVKTVYKYSNDDRYNGSIATKEIIYVPIKELEEVYDIFVDFNDKIVITQNNKNRSMVHVTAEEPLELKYAKDASSKVVERVEQGNYIEIFDFDDTIPFNVARSYTGEIGYVSTEKIKINQIEVVSTEKTIQASQKNIKLAWDYLNPDVSGIGEISSRKRVTQLDVVAPTILFLQNVDGEVFYRIKTADEYIKWAKNCDYDIWVTFKNDSNTIQDTSDFLNDMNHRKRAIDELIAFCQKYSLQGINVDFENMYQDDGEAFAQFVRELAVETRKQNLVLSVCVNVPDGSPTWSLCYKHKSLSEAADYIAVMTYDQNGASAKAPGPNASYEWVEENIKKLVERDGIEPKKLLLGLAFYSRFWKYSNGNLTSSSISMQNSESYISKSKWNDSAKQYYYENSSGTESLWIEDKTSISEKVKLIDKYDLGGFAIWKLGFESKNVWEAFGE